MKKVRVVLFVMVLMVVSLVNFGVFFINLGPKLAFADCGEARDPHFHVDDWTVCMNQLQQTCGSN